LIGLLGQWIGAPQGLYPRRSIKHRCGHTTMIRVGFEPKITHVDKSKNVCALECVATAHLQVTEIDKVRSK